MPKDKDTPTIREEWRMVWPAKDGRKRETGAIRRFPITGSGIVMHRTVTETPWEPESD